MMSLTGVFPSIYSVPPAQGLPRYCNAIKDRLSKITMRSLSKEYLKKQVDKIKKILPAYEIGKTDYKKVLAFGDDDRFLQSTFWNYSIAIGTIMRSPKHSIRI